MSSASPSLHPTRQARLERAIRRAQNYLLSRQHAEGYWWAELEANVTLTAEYVMLHRILEQSRPVSQEHRERIEGARRYLLGEQRQHGGWELYYGDGGELSTTIEAYFALRLCGERIDSEPLVRARRFILERGGLARARVFTKIHLALFGAYPWRGVPTLPPWFMLLPPSFPLNIYEMASWARSTTVPLLIICDRKPVYDCGINADELFAGDSQNDIRLRNDDGTIIGALFIALDRLFKLSERARLVPFRARALAAAERWVIERQEASGDWAGIIPAMLNSLLALHLRGYALDHPRMKRGLESIDRFGIEERDGQNRVVSFRLQPCVSPTWDTALALTALLESGMGKDHPRLAQAGRWLLSQQILSYGDWAIKNRSGSPGGWAFEFHNSFYPDVDDTAAVVLSLLGLELEDEEAKREACLAGARWVRSMECRGGGWAAFDIDNTQDLFNRMPYGDLKAMIDPPTADLTGRVLEMFSRIERDLGVTLLDDAARRRSADFLLARQEKDGCWWGRWGVNYLYGTYLALTGLRANGLGTEREEVRRAARWVCAVQNEDGGWGESCESYVRPEKRGRGRSTPSQTAWALLALIAAGEGRSEAAARGIDFLLARQQEDGSWDEPEFTGTGFPGHFYINYHQYRNHFPLLALARYDRICRVTAGAKDGEDGQSETRGNEPALDRARGERGG